LLSDKIVKDRT